MNDSSVPAELKARYVHSFAQKAIEIKACLTALQECGDDSNIDMLKKLQLIIHKLKGSSSSYGFNDIGANATALLKILEKNSPDQPATIAACEKVLQSLETAYTAHTQHLKD